MSNRTLLILALVLVGSIGALMLVNVQTKLEPGGTQKYLPKEEVQSISIYVGDKEYTPDFDQQTTIMEILNQSLPVGDMTQRAKPDQLNFDRMLIHPLNKKADVEILPIAYLHNALIFSAPEWNKTSYLQEYSNGRLKDLISTITKK